MAGILSEEGVTAIVLTTTGDGIVGPEQVTGVVAATPAVDAEILEFPALLQVRSPCPANEATTFSLLAHVAVEVTSAVLPSE